MRKVIYLRNDIILILNLITYLHVLTYSLNTVRIITHRLNLSAVQMLRSGADLLEFTVPPGSLPGGKLVFDARKASSLSGVDVRSPKTVEPFWMVADVPIGCAPGWKLTVPMPAIPI